jgi:hypothetical protein
MWILIDQVMDNLTILRCLRNKGQGLLFVGNTSCRRSSLTALELNSIRMSLS